jgi:Plasmid replication region DNA-binding N-term
LHATILAVDTIRRTRHIALKPVPNPPEGASEPKASRARVWQACDRVLRSGRRPTVEGIREILGGGSPNSVTAYIQEWYQELGSRLTAAETPLAGFPPEAVSLMTELWRLAATDQPRTRDSDAADETATRMLAAERDAIEAEAKALQTLNQELQRHRSTAEKSLAEARALLSRREAALEEERLRAAGLEQALVQARLELEVLLERRRLTPGRTAVSAPTRKPKRRKRPTARTTNAKPKIAAKRPRDRNSSSRTPAKPAPRRTRRRNRR